MLGHFQVVPQRGKPKRQPHFKSKSGCPTCKIRHLKCDEAKPICRRCATAGLACDGYLYDSKTYTDDASRPLAKVLLPRLQNLTSSIERSLDLITASSQDKRCFHFFRTASVPQLTGHFDAEFWTSQLLKICHSEPGVWHSVLALGALHEDFICSHKKSKDGSLSVTRRFALGHYNQAIRVLTQTKRLDVILVSCFMFVIMELLLGNIEGAINQLHSGTRIFSARRAEIARKGLKPDTKDKFIEEYLLGPFHHLNLYSYIWGRPPARTVISPDPSVEDCPRTYDFQSLIQARASLLDVIISGGGTSGLQEWEEAFNEFLAQQGTAISSPRQIRSIEVIKLQHKWASICVPNLEETKFDAFVREFELGLNIADSQLRDDSGGLVPNDLHPAFSMTLQNFSTVYLTAIKCRNPALRRRALNLLKSSPNHPDHESFWNASTAIRLIERVIEIEEEGLEDLTDLTGSVVPSEWSRIQYIEKIPEAGQENSTTLFRFRRKVDGEWQHFLERF